MTQTPENQNSVEMDYELARAIQLSIELESVFGVNHLPRGERLVPVQVEGSVRAPSSAVPEAPVAPLAAEKPAAQAEESLEQPAVVEKTLDSLAQDIAACTACDLCHIRTRVVPGQGSPTARLMFVGEAPGADEDASGLPFVGKAGQLLTKMIEAMGLSREEVFIANILKCRPPENRNPQPEEAQACLHYLLDQIDLVKPEMICALGAQAANNLLGRAEPIGQIRGQVFDFQGTKLIPTYHPAYLLREPSAKRAAWQDLQKVMDLLGLKR